MDCFETPCWDGDKEAEKWTSELFGSSKIERFRVSKKRKRNKYPKGLIMEAITNSSQPVKDIKDDSTLAGSPVKPENPDKTPLQMKKSHSLKQTKKKKHKKSEAAKDDFIEESASAKTGKKYNISTISENYTIENDFNVNTKPRLNSNPTSKSKKEKNKKKFCYADSEVNHDKVLSNLKTIKNKLDLNLQTDVISKESSQDFNELITNNNFCEQRNIESKNKKSKKTSKTSIKRNKTLGKNKYDSKMGDELDLVVSKKWNNLEGNKAIKKVKKTEDDCFKNIDAFLKDGEIQTPTIKTNGKPLYDPEKLKKMYREHGDIKLDGIHENDSIPSQKKNPSLREKMMEKLRGARFRFLNEQIYNSNSKDTNKFFQSDQKSFEAYHEGYKQQLMQWPVKPIDLIIKSLKKKPVSYVIADFGCGDAQIAQSLANKVHSFDHVALNNHVTVCDMAHTPLTKGSVDVAVFCLSLMGNNLSEYISEANRVLKIGGLLKIAEVESRFDDADKFVKVISRFGFLCIRHDLSNDVFYLFDFRKEKNLQEGKAPPTIELRSCSYKKR